MPDRYAKAPGNAPWNQPITAALTGGIAAMMISAMITITTRDQMKICVFFVSVTSEQLIGVTVSGD